jgi:hypothetical protein
MKVCILAVLTLIGAGSALAQRPLKQEGRPGNATALFCAYGSVGFIPVPRPAGFESEFAVAVVEIRSPVAIAKVPISDFELFDRQGKATPLKRVTDADVFEAEPFTRARAGNLGSVAYYLNPGPGGGTHAWDGTLPAGTIRLRIRVALQGVPNLPDRFRIQVGTYVIEGRVDASWPT